MTDKRFWDFTLTEHWPAKGTFLLYDPTGLKPITTRNVSRVVTQICYADPDNPGELIIIDGYHNVFMAAVTPPNGTGYDGAWFWNTETKKMYASLNGVWVQVAGEGAGGGGAALTGLEKTTYSWLPPTEVDNQNIDNFVITTALAHRERPVSIMIVGSVLTLSYFTNGANWETIFMGRTHLVGTGNGEFIAFDVLSKTSEDFFVGNLTRKKFSIRPTTDVDWSELTGTRAYWQRKKLPVYGETQKNELIEATRNLLVIWDGKHGSPTSVSEMGSRPVATSSGATEYSAARQDIRIGNRSQDGALYWENKNIDFTRMDMNIRIFPTDVHQFVLRLGQDNNDANGGSKGIEIAIDYNGGDVGGTGVKGIYLYNRETRQYIARTPLDSIIKVNEWVRIRITINTDEITIYQNDIKIWTQNNVPLPDLSNPFFGIFGGAGDNGTLLSGIAISQASVHSTDPEIAPHVVRDIIRDGKDLKAITATGIQTLDVPFSAPTVAGGFITHVHRIRDSLQVTFPSGVLNVADEYRIGQYLDASGDGSTARNIKASDYSAYQVTIAKRESNEMHTSQIIPYNTQDFTRVLVDAATRVSATFIVNAATDYIYFFIGNDAYYPAAIHFYR